MTINPVMIRSYLFWRAWRDLMLDLLVGGNHMGAA